MNFTSVAFSGPIVADPNNFGWCEISPTKLALIYTGWTGATVGEGTRKLFMQMVYLNGKSAPTFGPVSAVWNPTWDGSLHPKVCALGDGRLLISYHVSTTQFRLSVIAVSADDKFSLSFSSPADISVAMNMRGVPLVSTSVAGKVIACYVTGNRNHAYTVLVDASTISTTLTTNGTSAVVWHEGGSNNSPNWLVGQAIRRDRAGNIFIIRGWSSLVSGTTNYYGISVLALDPSGINLGYGYVATWADDTLDYRRGRQKGRSILPVLSLDLLNLASPTSGWDSTNGQRNFQKMKLGGLSTSALTVDGAKVPYRDARNVRFDDAIWLDGDFFLAVALESDTTEGDAHSSYGFTDSDIAKPQVAYIGKYDAPSNSLITADSFPMALPTKISPKQYDSNIIHKIDGTTVALIQCVRNSADTAYELNITVVGA